MTASPVARAGRALAIALPVAAADQASKWLAVAALSRGEVVEVLPFANLRLGFNKEIGRAHV